MLKFLDKILVYITSLGGHAHLELELFFRYAIAGGIAAVADLLIVWSLVEYAHLHPFMAGAVSLFSGTEKRGGRPGLPGFIQRACLNKT